MKAVTIQNDYTQKLAAAALTQMIRSKFNLESPHAIATGLIEFHDKYNLGEPNIMIGHYRGWIHEILDNTLNTVENILIKKMGDRKKASEKSAE